MSTSRKVVVTGLGATTPLGGDVASTWEAALAGTSGTHNIEAPWIDDYDLPVKFAAQIKVKPEELLKRPEMKRLDPAGQYAVIASREAWADAGSPDLDPERLGVVIGTGIGGLWTLLDQWDLVKEKGPRRVNPFTVPMLMANSSAAHVELELGAKAGAHTPVSACASGAEAAAYALDMIRTGRADVVVTGGTEASVHALPIAAFANMRALSTRTDDPEGASRPYDVDRDGFVLGEGSGILVLESEEHALARGAKIYAEVASSGLSSDAHHIAAPDPTGAGPSRAMKAAVKNGDIEPRDLVHVNAHATSTPLGDTAEINAIRSVLGGDADHVIVSATKSMTGHLLGGAGALESIFTVLALKNRVAPPTINIDNLDPEVTMDVAVGEARTLPDGDIAGLNNAFGFGGHNVAVLFKSY